MKSGWAKALLELTGTGCPSSTTVNVRVSSVPAVTGTPADMSVTCSSSGSFVTRKFDLFYQAPGDCGTVTVTATTSGGGVNGDSLSENRNVRCD